MPSHAVQRSARRHSSQTGKSSTGSGSTSHSQTTSRYHKIKRLENCRHVAYVVIVSVILKMVHNLRNQKNIFLQNSSIIARFVTCQRSNLIKLLKRQWKRHTKGSQLHGASPHEKKQLGGVQEGVKLIIIHLSTNAGDRLRGRELPLRPVTYFLTFLPDIMRTI